MPFTYPGRGIPENEPRSFPDAGAPGPASHHPGDPGEFVVAPERVGGRDPERPRRRRRHRIRSVSAVLLVPALAVALFAGGVAVERAGFLPGPGNGGPAAPGPADPSLGNPPGVAGPDEHDADLALILEAWGILREHYVDAGEIDDRELAYGAIGGMTEVLGDEGHTTFLTPEALAAAEDALQGRFVGIGVYLEDDDGRFLVRDVIPGTPAEEGGLRAGDRIVAVDGAPVDSWSSEDVVSAVRGPADTPVTLTLQRAGVPGPFHRTLVRRELDLPVASWAVVPGHPDVALVRLESFSSGAADALRDALRAARAAGATSLVFDLRGNPGGYVSEAVAVASQFLAEGVVYVTRDADGQETPSMVQPGGVATDLPLVVLVDGGTASSAEIVSSAIQDAGRGILVGEQTFGTGTVVSRFDLSDGSALRVGTVRWLTRDGRPLWHEGVTPDELIQRAETVGLVRPEDLEEMADDALGRSADRQLLRALELLADE
jgi:carboxyl-terminal processing protease